MGVSKNQGLLFGSPYNQEQNISELIWGPMFFCNKGPQPYNCSWMYPGHFLCARGTRLYTQVAANHVILGLYGSGNVGPY